MDNGWYIQGKDGKPISDMLERDRQRYGAVADFSGVPHHNGTIREIDFLEALASRFQRLEERDKPKKPVDDDCPSCNLLLMGNYDFCPRCGQRLIWEDDENES